jgi:hypothetical protein
LLRLLEVSVLDGFSFQTNGFFLSSFHALLEYGVATKGMEASESEVHWHA